jgi:hypothetical protein
MTSLESIPTDILVQELTRRSALPPCACGKWTTYVGSYDADGYTLRCRGCLRAVAKCGCK